MKVSRWGGGHTSEEDLKRGKALRETPNTVVKTRQTTKVTLYITKIVNVHELNCVSLDTSRYGKHAKNNNMTV